MLVLFFFFKQKTAYEMRMSDWSSDVCSSDLLVRCTGGKRGPAAAAVAPQEGDRGYAGEQGAGCGVGNLARRIEEGALIGTLVYDMVDGELAADLALDRKRGVEDDRLLGMKHALPVDAILDRKSKRLNSSH